MAVRDASTPIKGAGRAGVQVAIAGIATHYLGQVLPAEIMANAEILIVAAIAAVAAYIGKWARDNDVPLASTFL